MAYIFDASKGDTPEIIAQRRKLSDALAARIFGKTPQNVGEGLSALGQAWIAGTMRDEADAAQKAGQASGNAAFSNLFGGAPAAPAGSVSPMSQSAPAAPSGPQIVDPNQVNSIDVAADLRPATQNLLPKAQNAIAGIESGGRYNELGPVTKTGDRAYGKYQVMGANIPQWTKEVLGREMTPQEFVSSPDAQDAVFNGKFGNYMQKYGPEGAAKAWFAGEGGMKNPAAKDQLGTTVAGYGQRFSNSMGGDEAAIPPAARPTQAQSVVPPSTGPDLNTLIQASTNPWLDPSQRAIVNTMLQQKLKEQDPLHQLQLKKAQADLDYGKNPESVREYEYAKGQGFVGSFQDWIAQKRAGAGEYSLTPIYGKDAQGNTVLVQPGKSGTAIQTKLPDGVTISSGVEKVDLGTQWGIMDKRTGQIVGYQPKDIRGAAREHGVGEAQGKELASAPGDILAANNALDLVEQIKSNPYLDRGTGVTSLGNWVWGTGGHDFENLVQGAKSGSFLQAIQQMRGLGSLSDAEGRAATSAINRMDTSTSKTAFLKAVSDYEKIVNQGLARAKGRLQNPSSTNPTNAGGVGGNTTSGGVKWSAE